MRLTADALTTVATTASSAVATVAATAEVTRLVAAVEVESARRSWHEWSSDPVVTEGGVAYEMRHQAATRWS